MKYYVVDAFTGPGFLGNPAGVCVVDEWPSSAVMQSIAAENNLSETAFVVKRQGFYDLRWFTPETEVDLCGHATLGTSCVIARFVEPGAQSIIYHSNSGVLTVERTGENSFLMDFPVRILRPVTLPRELTDVLGVSPLETFLSRDLFVVLESEKQVRSLNPDFTAMKTLEQGEGIIVTARGKHYDFVSRCFYPKFGINEDPVTGSAHCNLIPYWATRLGKTEMTGAQLSHRGGLLHCKLRDERVGVGGETKLYLTGEIVNNPNNGNEIGPEALNHGIEENKGSLLRLPGGKHVRN